MTSAEAVEVVHQMMEAREQEEARTAALASQVATKKYDPSAARQRFWKEVAIYPLTLVCAAVYTLLMAVVQLGTVNIAESRSPRMPPRGNASAPQSVRGALTTKGAAIRTTLKRKRKKAFRSASSNVSNADTGSAS